MAHKEDKHPKKRSDRKQEVIRKKARHKHVKKNRTSKEQEEHDTEVHASNFLIFSKAQIDIILEAVDSLDSLAPSR